MAICTQCGALMQDADMSNHICNPANLPQSGMEIVAGSVVVQAKKIQAVI